ncbi:hypothetical protein L6452_29934 [Arctium lappa]|uniref:Uncharacterized protein n=1 Tax=Arctium lappa TaxID=4217 RepID=A0ACB8ZHG7_ARCLA|nr:hypothetical protein L6452_29934 [Arctium lappa]
MMGVLYKSGKDTLVIDEGVSLSTEQLLVRGHGWHGNGVPVRDHGCHCNGVPVRGHGMGAIAMVVLLEPMGAMAAIGGRRVGALQQASKS